MLLSLSQFESVFPKTSKLCITYAEFSRFFFLGCCVVSLTGYLFTFDEEK